jgi:nitrite reductase/ring-hydroxylating ferredoxin subunit
MAKWFEIFKDKELIEKHLKIGSMIAVKAEELRICIVRTAETEFYGIDDRCPHNEAYFSKGYLNSVKEVVCPWHSYCYSLKTGEEQHQRTRKARLFEVCIRNGGLWLKV